MRLGPRTTDAENAALPLWPPLLATRGRGGESAPHAHHAMHIVACVEGQLHVSTGNESWQSAAGIITAPDVVHAIRARGIEILLVFLDPESDAGLSLRTAIAGPVRLLTSAERDQIVRDAVPDVLMRAPGVDWMRGVVAVLSGSETAARRTVHPRIKKLIGLLRSMPPDADTSLASLAKAVGLSPGRLMHTFTESIGVPLRPYLQWLKLQRAAGGIASGMSLAAAAHAAGFADSAHMSRTFRRTLGAPPSALRPRPS
jgi:AraC-like DNA-binding protein